MNISVNCLYQTALQWFDNMLFCNKMKLIEVPSEIRTAETSIYVTALRISRGISCERYFEDLTILCNDIISLEDGYFYKSHLIGTLSSYLSRANATSASNITEDSLNEFEKNLPEKLLYELYQGYGVTKENIRIELEKRGFMGRK